MASLTINSARAQQHTRLDIEQSNTFSTSNTTRSRLPMDCCQSTTTHTTTVKYVVSKALYGKSYDRQKWLKAEIALGVLRLTCKTTVSTSFKERDQIAFAEK